MRTSCRLCLAVLCVLLNGIVAYPPTSRAALAHSSASGLDGVLDPSFGQNGKWTSATGGDWPVTDMEILLSGKILIVGNVYPGFALRRHEPDGSVDSEFGQSGVVTTTFSDLSPEPLYIAAYSQHLAIETDGKILVTGAMLTYPCLRCGSGTYTAVVARYLPDGALDPTYGHEGRMVGGPGSGAAALQSDDKLLIVGQDLRRYLTDGTPDQAFGQNGVVAQGGGDHVAVYPDGRIVVGRAEGITATIYTRFLSDGQIDTTFGTSGVVTHEVGLSLGIGVMVVQSDLKMLIAENVTMADTSKAIRVTRLNESGAQDSDFGALGEQVIRPMLSSSNYASDGLIQPDGKIVIVGSASPNLEGDFLIARLDGNGRFDPGFGVGGVEMTDFYGGQDGSANADWARAADLTPDYKLVVAGRAYSSASVPGNYLALVRYEAHAGIELWLPQIESSYR